MTHLQIENFKLGSYIDCTTICPMPQVKTGDIVAAKFPHDDSWYRGQVCSYEPNEDDSSQSLVTVYYVDFGDTETIKMDCVFELRTDYLKLNFQAIECFLANIKPE